VPLKRPVERASTTCTASSASERDGERRRDGARERGRQRQREGGREGGQQRACSVGCVTLVSMSASERTADWCSVAW
jgi:hypothetical protein